MGGILTAGVPLWCGGATAMMGETRSLAPIFGLVADFKLLPISSLSGSPRQAAAPMALNVDFFEPEKWSGKISWPFYWAS